MSGSSVGDGGVGEIHDCGLMQYLGRLASGSATAAALDDWPGPDPQFCPVDDQG